MLPDYVVVDDSPDRADFSIEELLAGVDFERDRKPADFARNRTDELRGGKPPRPKLDIAPLDIPTPKPVAAAVPTPRKEASPSLLSRAVTGMRDYTKGFNPSIGGIVGGIKSLFSKPVDEGNSPEVAAKNKRLQTYTGHMDNVRRELEPLGISDLWKTPLNRHASLREDALNGGTRLNSLEHSFGNAINHIDNPTSKNALSKKLDELKALRAETTAYKEENPDLPPLEMWPETVKGKKGAVNQYRAEGLKHLEEGGDHNSLVEHYMRTHGLKERTAKRHSLNTHKYLKDQLKREQESHEKWIEDYMKNHLDLPTATEIP